jgi:hypothetical protein
VLQLWLEIAPTQPSFLFEFGHGLGVWKKNTVCEDDLPFIRKLFGAPAEAFEQFHVKPLQDQKDVRKRPE